MTISFTRKSRFGDQKAKWERPLADPALVTRAIDATLPSWLASNTPSVWVTLRGADLDHVQHFIANGFIIHRIKGADALVLNRWVKPGVSNLPPGPFAYFGCGALCVNDEGKVLAVRENLGSGPGPWKLPGGLYDSKKDADLGAGAVREVFEETGIRAEFNYVACQRFAPNSVMFHSPDVYTICRLTPLTTEIKIDPVEIAACEWLDPEAFLGGVSARARPFLEAAVRAEAGLSRHEQPRSTAYYTD
jgi:8-oxo-dGTP pyrophosphatase MutT (NUDIX family)